MNDDSKNTKESEEEIRIRAKAEAEKNARKSLVRVLVTYAAAIFLFVGGPIFICFLIWTGQRDDAIALFNTLLPVSAAIISYWFAGRGNNPE